MHEEVRDECAIAPTNLLCEYTKEALGLDTPNPRLSWQPASDTQGGVQAAYQVLVASSDERLGAGDADRWDSGKVESSQSTHVPYRGEALRSGETCWWRVRCWDGDGVAGPFSGVSTFGMGLLAEEDWQGAWIGADESISAPLFRKQFVLDRPVQRARAYICGLGYCELHLNGVKVGGHVLDPCWTDYDDRELRDLGYPFDDRTSKRVLYVTHDVTECLQPGANAVGVMLGNGWYNQRERSVEGKLWYGAPRLILQLNIQYTDGHTESVVSDGSWVSSSGPITFNNIFMGEVYDARLEKEGWDRPGYDDSQWEPVRIVPAPAGELHAQTAPPDKVRGHIQPISIAQPRPGVFIFDMGQNFSGWAQLKVQGPAGTEIVLRFAEELDSDGLLDFGSAGGDGQIQRDTYLLKGGGPEQYEPRFTWHTFRYVEVTGYPGAPDQDSLEGVVVHSAVDPSGEFRCSNSLFDRIQTTYRWTHLSSMHGGVTMDCPHRERLGYTGDGHLTAETAMYNFWTPQFYAKWTNDMADAQNRDTGFVPHTAPFYGGGGGPGWGSAYVIVPWHLYQFYGDVRVLEEHYDGLAHWLEYLGTCTDGDHIVVREEPGSWCLGDWCLPDQQNLGYDQLPPSLVNTFMYATVARLMAQIARALGRAEDAARFHELAEAVTAAFHGRFYDEKGGRYANGQYGADAFGLAMEPVPSPNREHALKSLLHRIQIDDHGHLDTGIIGTPILLDVLVEHGHESVAYEILTKTTYPSYGHMLESGATTLWESWAGGGSHCHPMFGSVSGWFFKNVAGLQTDPAAPGFEKIIIRPRLTDHLKWAAASVRTLRGLLAVHWRRQDGRFQLQATIPPNTSARVFIPKSGLSPLTIEEAQHMIWRDGTFHAGCPGVEHVEEGQDAVIVTVGAGAYLFGAEPGQG